MTTICDLAKEAGIAFYTRNFKRFEKLTKEAIKKALPNAKVVFLPTGNRDKFEPDIEFIPSKDKVDNKFTIIVVYKTSNFIPISSEAELTSEDIKWFYIAAVMFELAKTYLFITNKSYRKKVLKYASKIFATSGVVFGLPTSTAIFFYLKPTAKSDNKGAIIVSGLFGFLISALFALVILAEKDLLVQVVAEEFGCPTDEADTMASYKWMQKYLIKVYKTSYIEITNEVKNYTY